MIFHEGELQYVTANTTHCCTSFHVLILEYCTNCIALVVLHCHSVTLLYFWSQRAEPPLCLMLLELLCNLSAKSAFTIFPLILEWVKEMTPLSSLFLSSLMDREVTLLGEMDKVKAESSKYCMCFKCHIPPRSCWYSSHNMITWLKGLESLT